MNFKIKPNTEIMCKKNGSQDESVQKLCVLEPNKNGLRLEDYLKEND